MEVFTGLLAWIPPKAEAEKTASVQTTLLGSKSEGEKRESTPQADLPRRRLWEGRIFIYLVLSPSTEHQGPACSEASSEALGQSSPKPEKLGATAQVKHEAGPREEGCKRLLSGGVCLPGGDGRHLPESTA